MNAGALFTGKLSVFRLLNLVPSGAKFTRRTMTSSWSNSITTNSRKYPPPSLSLSSISRASALDVEVGIANSFQHPANTITRPERAREYWFSSWLPAYRKF